MRDLVTRTRRYRCDRFVDVRDLVTRTRRYRCDRFVDVRDLVTRTRRYRCDRFVDVRDLVTRTRRYRCDRFVDVRDLIKTKFYAIFNAVKFDSLNILTNLSGGIGLGRGFHITRRVRSDPVGSIFC